MAWRRGDVEKARQVSRDALKWNIISTFIGVILFTVIFSIFSFVVIVALRAMSSR